METIITNFAPTPSVVANTARKDEWAGMKYLTQKELSKLFRTIEKSKVSNRFYLRDLCMVNIAYLCWLRTSEVGMLRLEQYNSSRGEIFIKRLKGSSSNTLRLDETRKNLLEKYIREYRKEEVGILRIKDESDFLFKSKNGKQLWGASFAFIFREFAKEAGLPESKQHPHTLKHSIGIHLTESGVDIKDLQYYLGHKNVLNTMTYFKYTSKQFEDLYRKIWTENVLVS